MNTVKIKSYAKVNLTLEIVGRTAEYHMLDSLLTSVDLYDLICVKKRKDKLCTVKMKGLGSEEIAQNDNNALKAAQRFVTEFDTCGADITVYKNIPLGSGLGGSSADASGVLRGMAKLYDITDTKAIETLADTLGSDTKYMLTGGFARMRGRGDCIQPTPMDTQLYMLFICPNTSVSSGACYREYDAIVPRGEMGKTDETGETGKTSATEKCLAALQQGNIKQAGMYLTNDLFPAATRLNADVRKAWEEAASFSPLGVSMTGSGSCVIALFESKELCDWAASRYRGEFCVFTGKSVRAQTD